MTRKEREKQKARRERNRGWGQQQEQPLSEVVGQYDALSGEQRVLVVSRVSTPEQDENGDLQRQENRLKVAVTLKEDKVAGTLRRIGSGKDPTWLNRVEAKRKQCGATVVLFDSVCRILRPQEYSKFNQQAIPTREDLETALSPIQSPVVTLLHPDATLAEIRSHQTKDGKPNKKKKAGYRKKQKQQYRGRAQELYSQGMGCRKISSVISYESGVPITHETVRKWLQQSDTED